MSSLRIVLLFPVAVATLGLPCAGCARGPTLEDLGLLGVSGKSEQIPRAVARNNELKRHWYRLAASGRGRAELRGHWHTKEGDKVFDELVVNDGRVELVQDFSGDHTMPFPRRLLPYRKAVGAVELGLFDGDPAVRQGSRLPPGRFVPSGSAPPGGELFIRYFVGDGSTEHGFL